MDAAADSSVNVDLMDTSEFLIEDWDIDISDLLDETDNHTISEKTTYDSSQDMTSETGGTSESACSELRPAKQMKSNIINDASANKSSSPPPSSSSLSQFICFQNSYPSPSSDTLNFSNSVDTDQQYCWSTEFGQGTKSKTKDCSVKKQPQLLKEHVLAERNRRQRLNERVIALSALLPGLKKADKMTVLEDAINHLKQLQLRIKQLEEERISATNKMKSVILVKKSRICIDEDDYSGSISSSSSDEDLESQTLPQIEARVSNDDILIRIHCEKSKVPMAKIMSEIDKLRLDVINSFTMPFGNSALEIAILAKMDKNLPGSVKDVVKNIRLTMVD